MSNPSAGATRIRAPRDYPDMGTAMHRYRYRTEALAGPWRDCAHRALDDAVRARQARVEGRSFEWLVQGWVETQARPAAWIGRLA